jgi:AGZA family xanthine/uracil permease-like MFS transporter
MTQDPGPRTQDLLSVGDLNAFFALLLDNVVNLVLFTAILAGAFGFPAEFVVRHMVPGTALGVLLGDLAYSWMAVRLTRRTGKPATAMPLGLDTPSTIGMAVAVIGPAYVASGDAMVAWEVGLATLFLMGVAKVAMSFLGDSVLRLVPRAGLLGPLAGIGLALLGLFPVLKLFSVPVAGVVAMGVLLYALVAGHALPGRVPGALAAVAVGAVLFFVLGALGLRPPHDAGAAAAVGLNLPVPVLDRLWAGLPAAVDYLPISLPLGLLTIVGGINCTESARAAGDAYRTRDVLLVEAVATLVAGACGGVVQSTPYIGHPAYKDMGARSGYTLGVAVVVGVGGCLGLLGVLLDVLPGVAVAPILLFVGIEIAVQAFTATERRHLPAVAFSIVPVLAYLVSIYTGQLLAAGAKPNPSLAADVETIRLLGGGFILTAMLWGAALAFLIDRRPRATLATFAVLAVFSLFGVVHSVHPAGALYLPSLADPRPLHLAAAYALTGAALAGLLASRPAD